MASALDERGWDQEALARRLKVKQSTVSRWLSGKRIPTLDDVLEIAKLLGIPPTSWRRERSQSRAA